MRATQPRWRLGYRPALDGLRGVAVLIVIADHAGFLREPAGGVGVTVFFVLSGFLITRVIVEARDAETWAMPSFVANRFVRLFPALALMVTVVSTVLLARGFPVDRIAARSLPALAYVQNMAPPLTFPVFGHTWSLGVEEQFYLLWPLALPWVLRRRSPVALLVAAILVSVAWEIAMPEDWLPMHAYALLAGCSLAVLGPHVGQRWMVPVGAVALAGAIAVGPHFSEIYVYGPMVAAPAAVLLVAGAARGNRTLELAPLRFVGRVSYAWYLWHVPLLRLTGTTYAGIAAVPPLVVAFVIAVGSTFLLEEPLRRAWRARQEQTRVQVPAAFEPRGSQPRPSTP